jgi:hypothetical protein
MAIHNTTYRFTGSTAGRVAFAFSLAFGALSFAPTTASAEVTLADIIRNLQQNEELYENIEIAMQETYDIGDRKPEGFEFSGRKGSEISHKQSETRCVSQGKWFRIDRKGVSKNAKRAFSLDRFRAFDGEKTRVFEQNAIANISDERLEDSTFIRPHMLAIRYMDLPIPFSVYLSGHEAIRKHPLAQWSESLTLDVSYEGEDTLANLTCHRVFVMVRTKSGHVSSRVEFWLAEERNYLPIKRYLFSPSKSKTIPIGESTMSDLREIKPGIWMPFDTTVKAFDRFAVRDEGRQKLRWKQQYVVERAELDPKYDRSFFSNMELPDGAAVYQLEDRKIVRSWRQGGPKAKGAPTTAAGFQKWWILWVNVAVVLLLVAIFVVRKMTVTGGNVKQ